MSSSSSSDPMPLERMLAFNRGRARIVAGEERERLYDRQAAAMPRFNEYREKTSREIPVVVIERV